MRWSGGWVKGDGRNPKLIKPVNLVDDRMIHMRPWKPFGETRRADFQLRPACSKGSNGGGKHYACRTKGRSHKDTRTTHGGCSRWTPFRKWPTREWDPINRLSYKTCSAQMAATNTLMVETESPWSSSIWKKNEVHCRRTIFTSHLYITVTLKPFVILKKIYTALDTTQPEPL